MKKDIFDRIMEFPGLRVFEAFYRRHKEMLLYLFFGGAAFVISVASYAIANVGLGINELVANLISWILAVMFSFFTNRTWVFEGKTNAWMEFWTQMFRFFMGRVVTLLMEELILFVFITWMQLESIPVKISAQIVVIVLNYVISKMWIFKQISKV